MPVNSLHPEYTEILPEWIKAREMFKGEVAIHSAGERYLPRLDDQSDEEYEAYKSRASFYNATARTVDAYLGMLFRKDPEIVMPRGDNALGAALELIETDADMLGNGMVDYCRKVSREVILMGRCGTLIDWENENENRAYACFYAAENIINWRSERIKGRNLLTLLVLKETISMASAAGDADGFVPLQVEQYRVLHLTRTNEGNVYSVEIWRPKQTTEKNQKNEYEVIATSVPLRSGKPIDSIPFVFHGPVDSREEISKLPLTDIMAINLDHYRLNADYKHGMHYTALPTAWVSGFDKNSIPKIGSNVAWVSETAGATAGFLEFTGQGLSSFERALERDEHLMSSLGSSMVAQNKISESAEALQIKQNSENSVLSNLAKSLSHSMTQILRWCYWWNSTSNQVNDIDETLVAVILNKDFSIKGMTATEIAAVVRAWQDGMISQETALDVLRRGEVIPATRTNDDEKDLIAMERAIGITPELSNGKSSSKSIPLVPR